MFRSLGSPPLLKGDPLIRTDAFKFLAPAPRPFDCHAPWDIAVANANMHSRIASGRVAAPVTNRNDLHLSAEFDLHQRAYSFPVYASSLQPYA